jgi:hypothetical protein
LKDSFGLRKVVFLSLFGLFAVYCSGNQLTVHAVMDRIVTRFYQTMGEDELNSLNNQTIMQLLSDDEKAVLASKHWTFHANVPVMVSVMRHVDQTVTPFWLAEIRGFKKTKLIVRNEEYTYEVWQKNFPAGKVELGINGFDKHRPHYFVCVNPVNEQDNLQLSQFYPENQYISKMEIGAFTYHDWDELVLLEIPDQLKGQYLLTTKRGRARDAHLIHAFRKTPFPSSK